MTLPAPHDYGDYAYDIPTIYSTHSARRERLNGQKLGRNQGAVAAPLLPTYSTHGIRPPHFLQRQASRLLSLM